MKCTVWSLSVDSQNIPGATPKRRGSWVFSVYLWAASTQILILIKRAKDEYYLVVFGG
jgi:hypothetical protein